MDQLGSIYGVTRERIRQVERRLRVDLERAIATDEWQEVRSAAHRLGSRVGAWARLSDVPELDPTRETDRLIAYLADLAIDDEHDVVQLRGLQIPREDDLPFVLPEDVLLDYPTALWQLQMIGVLSQHVDALLSFVGLRQVDGRWVRWRNNKVEQAVAILAAADEPTTARELARRTDSSIRSLRQRLYEDPRVQRVTRTEVGLRSWGMPEYTSVVDLMLTVIADRDGQVPISELAAHLEAVYDVNPGTVYSFSSAPVFVVSEGTIRARRPDEPHIVTADPARTPGITVLSETRFSYDLRVDRELLRGSGRTVPTAFGSLLGLELGRPARFTTQDTAGQDTGEVSVIWAPTNHLGPSLGSVRAQALHDAVTTDDLLRLTFDLEAMVLRHERLPG